MNFHKLVLTVLKTSIVKNEPQEKQYRNYKYFDSRKFNRDLKEEFSLEYLDSCSKFDEIFLKVSNRHAPFKKKMLRANHDVSKGLSKTFMKRSCLENIYFKKQDNHSSGAYKKQKKIVLDYFILKREKKFFQQLKSKICFW